VYKKDKRYDIEMKQMKLKNIKLHYRRFFIGSIDIIHRLRFLDIMVIFGMMRGSMKSGSTNIVSLFSGQLES
jgi:hypothetical protein